MTQTEIRKVIQDEYDKKTTDTNFNFITRFSNAVYEAMNKKTEPAEDLYYIQNKDAGYDGNAIVFWGLNSRGYTSNINKSEKFSFEEAKKICEGNPEKNKAWPVNYINSNLGNSVVTDSQYLDSENIVKF